MAEAAVSKTARLKVRLFPRAPVFLGMYANGQSDLIFNQACAGSSPAIPIGFRVGCSSTAERRTVDAKTTSSILASRPKTFSSFLELFPNIYVWRVRPARFRPPESQSGDQRFKSVTRYQFSWSCGREVRHSVVNGADEGSSPSSSALCRAP